MPFSDAAAAISAAFRLHLKGVELYYFFDEYDHSSWDFAVPIEVPRSRQKTLRARRQTSKQKDFALE